MTTTIVDEDKYRIEYICRGCNCQFKEEELGSECIDQGDEYNPPAYVSSCPQCGWYAELSEWKEHYIRLCENCRDMDAPEESDYCWPCTVDAARDAGKGDLLEALLDIASTNLR